MKIYYFCKINKFLNIMIRIALGADHAGFQLKEIIKGKLDKNQFSVQDFGTFSDESCDYPDFSHQVAQAVENKEVDLGLVFCGSGNGVNITANKHKMVRSALCWLPEIAELARAHNNANVCAIPARFLDTQVAENIVNSFLSTEFEGGRHQKRIDKI